MRYFLTKADGVVKEISEGVFTNEDYVSSLIDDDSSMGKLMLGYHPHPTTIRTPKGSTPSHWVLWEGDRLDVSEVDKNIVHFDEVEPDRRLIVSRGELSKRTQMVLDTAGMKMTPRGIIDVMRDPTPEIMLSSIIQGLYHIVEKHTLSSMASSSSSPSANKAARYKAIVNIFQNRENVLSISMLSSYVEPSPTIINRAYLLGSVYGIGVVNALINDGYYRHHHEQVSSVMDCWKNRQGS